MSNLVVQEGKVFDVIGVQDQVISKLAKEYLPLKIKGIDDKAGYEKVHDARMKIVSLRVKVTKHGKEMREEAVAYSKAIIAEEKRVISLMEPIESHLHQEEKAIDDAKAEIKMARARAEEARIQKRVDSLFELGMKFDGVNYVILELAIPHKSMATWTDDQFTLAYNKVKAAAEAENKRLAEVAEAEKKAATEREAAEKAEKERLAKVKIEQEKEAKRLEAERQTLEDRRKAIEKKENAAALEKAKAEAAKKAAAETKARMEREAKEQKEREEWEAKEKAEAERIKAEQAPDKEKLMDMANKIASITLPKLKTKKYQAILSTAVSQLKETVNFIRKESK
jgi:hypothetical protein